MKRAKTNACNLCLARIAIGRLSAHKHQVGHIIIQHFFHYGCIADGIHRIAFLDRILGKPVIKSDEVTENAGGRRERGISGQVSPTSPYSYQEWQIKLDILEMTVEQVLQDER